MGIARKLVTVQECSPGGDTFAEMGTALRVRFGLERAVAPQRICRHKERDENKPPDSELTSMSGFQSETWPKLDVSPRIQLDLENCNST